MTRRLTETFDPADLLVFSTSGGASIVTPSVPLVDFEKVLTTGNNSVNSVYILSDNPGEVYGGFFFRHIGAAGNTYTTETLIIFKQDELLLGSVRINSGNTKLELLVNGIVKTVGTFNIQLHTNYHCQFRYKVGLAGEFEVRLDEDLDVLTFSGDTRGLGSTYANRFEFPSANTGTYIESLYINDTDGAENNGFDGVVRMKSFVPTADGFWADWLLTSGVDGFAMLNQTPHDGDTTIIYSNVDGDKSSFVCPGHGLSVPSEIMAVSARWVVRKVSDGRIRPFFRIGGVDFPIAAANVPIGVGYSAVTDRRTTNPATALPWALGDTIDSFGLESVL